MSIDDDIGKSGPTEYIISSRDNILMITQSYYVYSDIYKPFQEIIWWNRKTQQLLGLFFFYYKFLIIASDYSPMQRFFSLMVDE